MSTFASHIMLDALTAAVSAAHSAGRISDEELGHLQSNEPESVVFYPSHDDGPYDEDDAAAIGDVGDRDMHAKLHYWQSVVDELGRDIIRL